MVSLLASNISMDAVKVRQLVDGLAQSIHDLGFDNEKTIGLHLDISPCSVVLLLAAIGMGLKVAICPAREPPLVQNNWLKGLTVKTVLSSQSKLSSIDAHWIQVEERFAGNTGAIYQARDLDKFISILRTSGTTGNPKSAAISGPAYRASASAVNQHFKVTKDSCWALSLPLFHVSGLGIIFRSLLSGSAIYVAQSHKELIEGINRGHVTHLSLVPAQLKRLLDEGVFLSRLKAVIIGGDALPLVLRDRALALNVPLFATYGLTETASMIWVCRCRTNQTCILPHAHLALAPDGEILVGGKSLFDGYIDEFGVLMRPIHDGLFATGDVAADSSQLQLIVRKNNQIISGGENIQAEEIECVLESHPDIVKAVVVGLKDDNLGMLPAAFIKWAVLPLSDQEVQDYLKPHLASYKWPCRFLPWPEDAPGTLKKPRAWFLARALLTILS